MFAMNSNVLSSFHAICIYIVTLFVRFQVKMSPTQKTARNISCGCFLQILFIDKLQPFSRPSVRDLLLLSLRHTAWWGLTLLQPRSGFRGGEQPGQFITHAFINTHKQFCVTNESNPQSSGAREKARASPKRSHANARKTHRLHIEKLSCSGE